MSTLSAEIRPSITYDIRKMRDPRTGDPTKRPFVLSNETINLANLSNIMSGDHGLMSGKSTHVTNTVISTLESVMEQLRKGNAVVLDNYLKFTPTLRGKVDPETGKPTSETQLCVTVRALDKMKLSLSDFNLVGTAPDVPQPKITCISAWAKKYTKDVIVRNKDIMITERNLDFDADMGDTVTLAFKTEEEPTTLTLTPTDCTSGTLRFAFPSALGESPAGTEIEMTLRTRSGVENGAFNVTSRKAVLADA